MVSDYAEGVTKCVYAGARFSVGVPNVKILMLWSFTQQHSATVRRDKNHTMPSKLRNCATTAMQDLPGGGSKASDRQGLGFGSFRAYTVHAGFRIEV